MSFIDIEFPRSNGISVKKNITYSTAVVPLGNKMESRKANWISPRINYNLNFEGMSNENIQDIINFFNIVSGKLNSFKFFSPDNVVDNGRLSPVDGSLKAFYILKEYSFKGTTKMVNVNRIIEDSFSLVGSSGISISQSYVIDTQLGLVKFYDNFIEYKEVSVICKYFDHVRFDTDKIELTMSNYNNLSIESLNLIQLI